MNPHVQDMFGDTYPNRPGSKAPGTSAEAAERIRPAAGTLRAAALALLRSYPHGLTADEVGALLKAGPLSIRPRLTELMRQGLAEKTTERRTNKSSGMSAAVYRAVP